MFASLTKYSVNPIFKDDFVACWDEFITSLKERNMVVESTLNRESRITYFSYAIWASREDFDKVVFSEVPELTEHMSRFENYCNDIQILHFMEVVK